MWREGANRNRRDDVAGVVQRKNQAKMAGNPHAMPNTKTTPNTTITMIAVGSSYYQDKRSPPMKIVLGSFIATPSYSSLSHNACDESSSAASYILGTSYFASNSTDGGGGGGISNRGGGGANSNSNSGINHRRPTTLGLNKDGRVPMEDRKGPFDQFKPKSLILSVSDVYFVSSFPCLMIAF